APFQRIADFARIVRGEEDDRRRLRLHRPEFRYRDLIVGEKLQKERLELVIRLVELVDEEHRAFRLPQRLEERTGLEEFLVEEGVVELVKPRDGFLETLRPFHQIAKLLLQHLRVEKLLAVFPLVKRLGLVEPFIALKPDERLAEKLRRRLGELGLADAGRTLDEQRFLQPPGEEDRRRNMLIADIAA